VPRVHYGASGAPKNAGPWPFSPLSPLNRPGQGVFSHSLTQSQPRPPAGPVHPPDGSPLKIGGDKGGPVQGISWGGPQMGAGAGITRKISPTGWCQGGAWRVKPCPAPPRNEH